MHVFRLCCGRSAERANRAMAAFKRGVCYTWGSGDAGRLGHGDVHKHMAPFPQELVPCRIETHLRIPFRKVVCGHAHTVLLSEEGKLYTFGNGAQGALGHGLLDDQWEPRQVEELDGVVDVAAGNSHTLALTKDGEVYISGELAGTDAEEQEEYKSTWNPFAGFLKKAFDHARFRKVGGLEGVKVSRVFCGPDLAMLVTEDGTLATWGAGGPKTGQGHPLAVPRPRPVPNLHRPIVSAAAGVSHAAAVDDAGEVYVWGDGKLHQLAVKTDSIWKGVTLEATFMTPQRVRGLTHEAAAVACGGNHTYVLSHAHPLHSFLGFGAITTWGFNENGCLGQGVDWTASSQEPVRVGGLLEGRTVLQIAAGWRHAIALTNDGVFAFGWGAHGSLGTGNEQDQHVPVEIEQLRGRGVVGVAAGLMHSAAVTNTPL
eukprot:tig00000254_g22454.t1